MPEGIELAYQAYYVRLVRLARQLVDDLGLAEELVQDVFVRIYAQDTVHDPTYAYLRAAVINQGRSVLRRRRLARRREPTILAGADDVTEFETAATVRAQVRAELGRLPRRQREVVVLRYFEDLSLREIAEVLGITDKAVSAALGRALDRIATSIGGGA